VTFRKLADAAAVEWKQTLLSDARPAACYRGKAGTPTYEFCLPMASVALNLLEDAREIALDRFARYRISWHHGAGGMPSNHLMSSQVACLNALAPHVSSPDNLKWLFAPALPQLAEVIPFGDPLAPEDHVTFEWVGEKDHLGERVGKSLSRGAQMTSADAAIRFRNTDGDIEIALIEWKFVERYGRKVADVTTKSNQTRIATYTPHWNDPESPLDDTLSTAQRLTEPLYQLGRQQLLAWRMEQAKELGATRVSVAEAAPDANAELWCSVPKELGDDLRVVWPTALRRPDRWVHLDTARWLEPDSPASADFKARYAVLSPVGAR
jgi:hypothetical protein